MTLMYPKHRTFVSTAIRNFARGQDCTLMIPGVCNRNPETTVHCHLRMFGMVGVNQKPHDFHGVHACSDCHRMLDRPNSWDQLGWDDVLRALMLTQDRLFQAGLLGRD